MDTGAYRAARAGDCLKAAFAVAVAMNLAEALWEPDGVLWTAARAAASVLFLVALVACVVLWVLRRRRSRSERP
ncbi:hypothetical protein ACFZDI_17300 [Streptomyces sp. NPDC007907]|uniref:hypothetical protein n=1 Tax=Streptomyces sp. NPDC007907 TaxID=3364789 RepID=UPI0036E3F437